MIRILFTMRTCQLNECSKPNRDQCVICMLFLRSKVVFPQPRSAACMLYLRFMTSIGRSEEVHKRCLVRMVRPAPLLDVEPVWRCTRHGCLLVRVLPFCISSESAGASPVPGPYPPCPHSLRARASCRCGCHLLQRSREDNTSARGTK